MKATIVKDNSFKTVGFEVISNGKRVYSWGVSPVMELYFCKTVNVKDWETDILTVMMLTAQLNEQEAFVQNFYEAYHESGDCRDNFTLNAKRNAARIEATKAKIENIINNIC